ncbi:MAG: type II toxin-antitoxin system VapC family toxin [Acidobacteria bacterium]|nr:type II toxin-antitoxin system VapC family toxin [Acidobacteriota bacterium]
MKFLLDSNTLRAYIDRHPTVVRNVERTADEDLYVASVVFAEQLRGRYDALTKAEVQDLLRMEERLRETQATLQRFQVLWYTPAAIGQLMQLKSKFNTRKRKADAIQAALALAEDAVVVTRNLKDFNDLLPDAKIENWIDRLY